MSRTITSRGRRERTKRANTILYKSHIDGRDLIPERYIVELVCLKLAKVKKVTLKYGFWSEPDWNTYYKFQIKIAYQLTGLYGQDAVVKAVREADIYTLRDKRLDPIVQKYLNPKEITPVEVKKFGENKPKKRLDI